jgi:ketosteroid isomerase-like protein
MLLIQAGGTYRGRTAVLGWMREWAEAWEEIEYTPEEFTDAGDTVLVSVRYDGRGLGSGARVEGTFCYVMKLRHGKLLHWELYPERTQALEAAGLAD